MLRKLPKALIAVLSLAAILIGIQQIARGVQEMGGNDASLLDKARQAARSGADEMTPYVSASGGISLEYPASWTTQEPAEGPVLFSFRTLSGVLNVNILSEHLAPGTALESYVQQNIDAVDAALTEQDGSPQLLDRHDTDVGGEPATRLRLGYVLSDPQMELTVTQVYVVHEARAFVITFTAPSEVHAEFDGLMDRILASIAFL